MLKMINPNKHVVDLSHCQCIVVGQKGSMRKEIVWWVFSLTKLLAYQTTSQDRVENQTSVFDRNFWASIFRCGIWTKIQPIETKYIHKHTRESPKIHPVCKIFVDDTFNNLTQTGLITFYTWVKPVIIELPDSVSSRKKSSWFFSETGASSI